ncbi:MAG: hypothetical protein QME52_03785 [Bacteroidota bacterium]|nr:hypothetical protein [Bacteroidota bacterium]
MRILSLIISLLFISYGCDLFSPRDSEPPTQGMTGFKRPDIPDIVLENFTTAITSHNVENYMRCFIDTNNSSKKFIFTPSSNILPLISKWDLEDERRYFQNLGEPISPYPLLEFSDTTRLNITSSSIEYKMNYSLLYPHLYQGILKVRGYMHLYMELDNQQLWAISRWDDSKTETDSTWSYLKYKLY